MEAIDTHAHIFERGLKLASVRRYAPAYDATLADYLGMLDRHDIAGGVLVQPSFLGTDNSYLLAGLHAMPGRLRGIAVVDPAVSLAALQEMDAAGVVGIRLNLVGNAAVPDLSGAPWRTLLQRLAEMDWQVEVHHEAGRLPKVLAPLLDASVKVVVDHFGRPDPVLGVDDPGFRALLEAAASRRVWVKLSGAYRNGANGRGQQIALDAMPLLRAAFGMDRLVWGSDWPHTQFEQDVGYPQSRRALDTWLPDTEERRMVLVDTPATLFRFR
ncbi:MULTISPECIES: amidohydrolase [unclassified Massilia]|uniref:amidohydrolase family protein n=1 Tax=unclassified Massilia TaxID=2609279 RepID=UPI000A6F7C9B|nr:MULTISPECIES: amidohydrolase family protein [unclassified Massilia]